MSDSCEGACCAVFPLDLRSGLFNPRIGGTLSADNAYIVDMLIPLTLDEAQARMKRLYGDRFPITGATLQGLRHGTHGLFTCRHWDEETRLCGAYESRPAMCSGYPYGSACERDGCDFTISEEAGKAWRKRLGDSVWQWDEAAQGWHPTSTDEFLWDRETGTLRAIPKEAPVG